MLYQLNTPRTMGGISLPTPAGHRVALRTRMVVTAQVRPPLFLTLLLWFIYITILN